MLEVFGVFVIWNIITFVVMGVDKYKARRNQWRISERRLLLLAFLFGALGILLGMKYFRHKTRHMKFTVGVPICLALNAVLIYGGYYLFSHAN